MTAELARCTCGECRRLDALPLRRHGIPGAYQTTFAGLPYGSGQQGRERDEYCAATGPVALAPPALEPTLF